MNWLTKILARTRKRSFGWTSFGSESEDVSVKVTEPYRQSVWVQRAIKKVASPVAAVPLQFSLAGRGGDELLENPELTAYWESPVWEAPGIPMNRYDFIEAAIGWLKLKGEVFVILDDTALAPFPDVRLAFPRGLLARPDSMRELIVNGMLAGWEYTDANRMRHTFLPQQVIQVKNWNPYNPWRGLAEYDAARIATESDYAASTFSRNLMQNNGDQGVFIVAKGGLPDDAQRQQIESQLRAKRDAQQRGEFRPLFLTGDIAIEDPKIKTVDTAYLETRLQNRHEIFLAFGVPPSMADKMESYSVGSASDWYLLINETCVPTGAKLAEAVERISRLLTGQAVYAWFNFDEHPVMQQVRRERIEAAIRLWSVGMPMESVSDYLDLGLPEFEGDDIGYLPFSVAPVGTELPEASPEYQEGSGTGEEAPTPEEPEDEEEEPEDDTEEPVEAMLQALRHGCPNHASRITDHESPLNPTLRDPRKLAAWRQHMAQRRDVMKGYASKFNRWLMRLRGEILAKLETSMKSEHGRMMFRAGADQFLFDLPSFTKQFLTLMQSQGSVAFQIAGDQLFSELSLPSAWQAPPPAVARYLQQRENKLKDVPLEVYDEIKASLQEGLDAGDGVAGMAARVRAVCNNLSKKRSAVIASTETAAVYGQARQTAMESAGIEYKIWLTSGLSNVRPAHAQAGRDYTTPIPLKDPFIVGGERLMFPGDPNGSPENVINCHCVSAAVPPEEAPQD